MAEEPVNLNIQAHVTHRVNAERTVILTREVISMDISPDPHNPTAPALVIQNDLILSEQHFSDENRMTTRLYCRDCDVYLVGNWEFA